MRRPDDCVLTSLNVNNYPETDFSTSLIRVSPPPRLPLLPASQTLTMSSEEDARWLDWVTKQFEIIAGDDKEISLDEFKTALKVKEVSHCTAA